MKLLSRFRASNLALLFAIVGVLTVAITVGVTIKNRAADDVLSDVDRNATVLADALDMVQSGEAYMLLGDPTLLRAYAEADSRLDVSVAQLERIDAGPEAAELIESQAVAVREMQQAFQQATADRSAGRATGGLQAQGERFASFDEAVQLNSESSSQLGHTSLERSEARTDPLIIGSILVLGGLIVALGFSARRDDRRRRRTRVFSEGLQAARTEQEAYELVGAHLEREVNGSVVAVFNRNNSADRLEATTRVEPGTKLADALEGARPDDCLAIRTAKRSTGGTARDDLLRCEVCGRTGKQSLCVPSIVGGEVIGSVLAQRERRFDEESERAIADGVAEAAPVVAHLRNLAVAERRAASDKLTGLPNKRSADDVFRQMLAQAGRTKSHLALVQFDLDHFKRVNDSYGHPKGDEVLAAVGSAVLGTIRENDFAARDGGEEFMAVLPGTDMKGALRVAEKLRVAIAELRVPGVDQGITASFGVACYPDDSEEREELLRKADRALYAAKRAGRNRVTGATELAEEDDAGQAAAVHGGGPEVRTNGGDSAQTSRAER